MTKETKSLNDLSKMMKQLGYTNVSLAAELSSVRVDGKKTSPATISRQRTGSLPINPSLILFLKARLTPPLLGNNACNRKGLLKPKSNPPSKSTKEKG